MVIKLLLRFLLGLCFVTLAACGGGGGSSNNPPAATVLHGVLVDAAVEGIRFETATQSGLTNASGAFSYQAGEVVKFYIGGILLGSATGAGTLTPIDLVPGATNETNPQVTNILRFLQSLDSDMDASNGIQISSTTRTAMIGQTLNFAQTMAGFEIGFNVVSNAVLGGVGLVTAAAAQAHMRATLNTMSGGAGSTGGGSTGGGSSGSGNQKLGSVTISGADTATTGSSYAPTIEGSSTIQTATSVSWGDIAGTDLGLSAVGNKLASLTFVSSTASTSGSGISIQLYAYSISCWPVVIAAAECSKITLDIAGKSLTLNNVQLTPPSTVVSTNHATAPIRLKGMLYWK